MKRFLLCKKAAILLLVAALVFAGFYGYMVARPVSYGMDYRTETIYEGEVFEGTMKFYPDGTLVNGNSNFNEETTLRYYYKDGYIFFTMAETEEAYAQEVAAIDADFETAVNTPFYAAKVNAFKVVSTGPDGYVSLYTCAPALAFAAVCGIVELAMLGLACASLILGKKGKREE